MRSSHTSLRVVGINTRTALGLIAAIGTLVAAPRFAHAQDATTAPSASPVATPAAPTDGAAAAPSKKPTQAPSDDPNATPSSAGTSGGTETAKPASDAAEKQTESKPAANDAASAKAQVETATPAAEEETTAPTAEKKEAAHAVYISGDFAFTRADVGGLSDSTGFDKTGANGLAYGFAVGYRVNHFRVGARFHANDTTEFDLWSVMAEVGYGFGFRPISPTIHLHGGYVFDTRIDRPVVARSLPQGNLLTPDVDIRGARVGVEVVGNVWLSETVRIGPFVGFDLLFLHRPKVDLPQSIYPTDDATRANPLFSGSGSGTGYIFNAGIRGTFDIGF